MKRSLAILALVIVVSGCPLAVMAESFVGDNELHSQAVEQGIAVPAPPQEGGGPEQDQQDAGGDPHDLGGGFRGTGSALQVGGPLPVWIGPVATMIMQLI